MDWSMPVGCWEPASQTLGRVWGPQTPRLYQHLPSGCTYLKAVSLGWYSQSSSRQTWGPQGKMKMILFMSLGDGGWGVECEPIEAGNGGAEMRRIDGFG